MNPSQPEDAVNRSPDRGSHHLERVLDLVRFLRRNCPWDAAQTPRSLVPYLLEEAHEVADALTGLDAELAAELGDLLLNVAFQIVLAEERGAFGAEEVVSAVEAKMRRRHPHLYGDGERVQWEELKRREREQGRRSHADDAPDADTEPAAPPSLLEGLPGGLDPLSRAHRIQDRVAAVGFDWENARGAFDKVAEELEEVREALESEPSPALEEELGDLLFAVVNLARLAGVHSLTALHDANAKFTRRFNALEALARARGIDLHGATLDAMDALWEEVKAAPPTDTAG
ncbi:MAG TPA: nucleoside triphosphate pyrophosphohydrolase [Longimicrobiales bacterium]|nr:nucleoside triphosphate pyrophosphohydrolase [Longimicrobiales bacterium]